MVLGFDYNKDTFNLNDTAELYASLKDVATDTPVDDIGLLSVTFIVQLPDLTQDTITGSVLSDGRGFLRFTDTDQKGNYLAIASFVLTSGEVRSVRCDFEVIDPFDPPLPSDAELLSDKVWKKIEDVFDSELGGPWLRDQTMVYFNKGKVPEFIDEGLMDINLYHPPTDLSMADFITQRADGTYRNLPLVTEAIFLAVVRHLIRSYVEQPLPLGAQIVYEDRRDYIQRWTQVYELEFQLFDHWVKMFKRGFLGLGTSKLLIANKAGRLVPAPMRSWGVGRGVY